MDARVIVILSLEAGLALALLYFSGALKKPPHYIISVLLVAAAFVLRGFLLPHETGDYQGFLTLWVQYFRDNGGFGALSGSIGNYNIPYLYFLAWFSYSGIRDLYLIKCLSIFFDVILAWSSMLLAGKFTQSFGKRLFCFFAVLFLPTVWLNGAYWGQCDSIYVAFMVLAVYLALDDRPWLSMVCAAASFGFKLQAVFILPVYVVLLINKKIKLKHFLAFPAAYLLMVLPAVLIGRPFWDTVMLYFSQTGSIGDGMNYNSSSLFSIITNVGNTALASKLAIAAGFAALLVIFAVVWAKRKGSGDRTVLTAAVLMAVVVPFLLPHMHDRYFFAADIFTLVLACVYPKHFPLPCLVQFGSLLGYHAYLKMKYLMPMCYGGFAMLAAVILAAWYFAHSFDKVENPEPKAIGSEFKSSN